MLRVARQSMGTFLILICGAVSCAPTPDAGNVTVPEEENDLAVTARTATPSVFEGTEVAVQATGSGGREPYRFRWDQNAGPDLALADVTADTLALGTITTAGRYVFRVVATDRDGFHAADFITITVAPAVTASAPPLAIVGEPTTLSAIIDSGIENVSLQWEVVRGSATFDDPTAAEPALTTTQGETVEVLLTATLPSDGPQPITTTRRFEIVSVIDLQPRVLIETNFGDITLELDGRLAPLHTVNFLRYVDDGFYDGLLFHRNVCVFGDEPGVCEPFVLQGGGFERVNGELVEREATRDPVLSEAQNGRSNAEPNSISLALRNQDPNSGQSEFFINVGPDNSQLDEQGFTVFGVVVEGVGIVDAIVAMERTDSPLLPGEVSLPVVDVVLEQVTRLNP